VAVVDMQAENRQTGLLGVLGRSLKPLLLVMALHVVAFGTLFALVVPAHYLVGGRVFGIGLALFAYMLGVRHAFDADHIAAIDNTTRKLVAENRRATSVGLYFSLGHSSVVFALGVLVAIGAKMAATLTNGDSTAHQTLSVIGTLVSGVFLLIIGLVNLLALISILRVWREARTGALNEAALEDALNSRGLVIKLLRPLMRRISKQGQMYPVGFLFGLGFDTASEVAVLVLVGAGVATGLPWYAVLVLPLLFASGMSLFDTLDGIFMQSAYQWAFIRPVRKIYYNLTTTGLSVAVALIIGGIEIIAVLNAKLHLTDPVSTFVAGINLDSVGYVIVALFVVVLAGSALYWRLSRVEERWTARISLPAGQPE